MPDFSPREAAVLLCVTRQAVAKACSEGRIKSHRTTGNGGDQYRIALTDLPEPAQVRYWVDRLKAIPQTDRRDYMHTLSIPDALVRKVAQAAAVPRKRDDAAPAPWTHEEFEQKTGWFNKLPIPAQQESIRRTQLLWAFEDMEVPEGTRKSDLVEAWARERGNRRAGGAARWHHGGGARGGTL